MKTKKKTFDCVEFQHETGEEYLRKLDSMTPEEREAYLAQRKREFIAMQARARAKRRLQPVPEQ